MSETQAMEIILETDDYQNFQVRHVPVTLMLHPAVVMGCRVLWVGAAAEICGQSVVSEDDQIPARCEFLASDHPT